MSILVLRKSSVQGFTDLLFSSFSLILILIMEQTDNFSDLLFQAITERQQMFDSFLLPKLQEEYRIMESSAKTLEKVLIKKGILHDDPYNYDSKIKEIEIPASDPYTETEKAVVIGPRLSQYITMLEFIQNYYQFTCDFLNTDRINRLINLDQCFCWEAFSNTSTRVNTKGLAELINTLRNGADQLSLSIINDSLSKLSKTSATIMKSLKNLAEFHRERYKTAVRRLVMPSVSIDPASLEKGTSVAMREIKRAFAVVMKGQPFYTELIEEILKEDYSVDHLVLQQALLAKISVTNQNAGSTDSAENFKPVLMDGIRILGSIAPQLDEITIKLAENQNFVLSLEKTFFHKLAEIFRKAFNMPQERQDIPIVITDPVTQTGKKENINFLPFIEMLKRRSRIFTGFTLRASATYQKVEAMDEQQILDLLTRHIAEMNTVLKQCTGLDEYFKQSVPSEMRERIRGIKVEMSAIRNALVKANQCRAEYASQVEEQQQMKKLGITNV